MAKWERLVVYSLLMVALFMGFRNNQQLITAMEGVPEEIRALTSGSQNPRMRI